MFYNCSNLKYLHIKNFNINKVISYDNIFDFTPENFVICIGESAFDQLLNKDVINRISLCSSIEEIYSSVKLYSTKYGFLKSINYANIPTTEQTLKQEND